MLTFEYNVVGLPDLGADDYRASDDPLALALGAVMKPSADGALAQKWEALVAIARSDLNDARKALLATIVENSWRSRPPSRQSSSAAPPNPVRR